MIGHSALYFRQVRNIYYAAMDVLIVFLAIAGASGVTAGMGTSFLVLAGSEKSEVGNYSNKIYRLDCVQVTCKWVLIKISRCKKRIRRYCKKNF